VDRPALPQGFSCSGRASGLAVTAPQARAPPSLQRRTCHAVRGTVAAHGCSRNKRLHVYPSQLPKSITSQNLGPGTTQQAHLSCRVGWGGCLPRGLHLQAGQQTGRGASSREQAIGVSTWEARGARQPRSGLAPVTRPNWAGQGRRRRQRDGARTLDGARAPKHRPALLLTPGTHWAARHPFSGSPGAPSKLARGPNTHLAQERLGQRWRWRRQ